jgi:hypothetical protein
MAMGFTGVPNTVAPALFRVDAREIVQFVSLDPLPAPLRTSSVVGATVIAC